MTYTLTDCRRWLKKWQALLRLQDWRITIAIERERDFDVKNRWAEITLSEKERCAHIHMLHPSDYETNERIWKNHPVRPETSLIHELLHLHIHPCEPSDDKAKEVEQAINMIADALWQLGGDDE